MAGQHRPRPPGIAVEPACNAKLPLHPAGQDNGFKRVQQDGKDDDDGGNYGESVHSDQINQRGEC
jgi:hypothetical protein